MRILHVIPQFPYFAGGSVIGGHASALLTLARAQARSGMTVTILSYTHGRRDPIEIEPRLRAHSLFRDARPGSVRYGLRFAAAAKAWAGPRRDQFDLVHVHSGFVDYLLVSSALARVLRLPTLHTLYCPIPRRGGRWRLPLVHALIRRAARRVHLTVAMSRNVADSMTDYGLGPVEIVPPPVDIDRFRPDLDTGATRRELGLDEDAPVVLFVGNAKPQKNMSGVLAAFCTVRERCPNARLVVTTELAQSSSDRTLAALRRQMSASDLARSVIQKGIVEDMPRLMRTCDVLVAPFLDSFGPSDYFMAALEAMACGRPVVVSAVGGMPEVVSDETGSLVDPHDYAAIARALLAFLTDPVRRRAAGDRARTYTQQHFDPARVAARYDDLYRRIAS